VVDDGARPVHLSPTLLQGLSYMAYVKGPAVQSFQSVPENQADIVQGIGELMGDPAGQLADSGQFLQIAPVVLVSLGDREPVPVTLQGDVGYLLPPACVS